MMAVAMGAAAPAHRRRDPLPAAEVAAAARGGIGVTEVPPQRDAATALLVGVLDHRPQPAGVLATKDLEAGTKCLDALDQGLEGDGGMHAPTAHALADARLDEHGHQGGRRALRDTGGERQLLDVGVALLAGPRGERPAELAEQRRREARECQEVLLDLQVRLVEEEDALRAVTVAPGAPGLLEVALERRRSLVADDVLAHRWRRRRGKRHDVARLEADEALAEREVRGAEVMAPLRYAVRLVDRDETGRRLLEQRAELVPGEGLGRGENEQRSTRGDAGERRTSIRSADRTVEPDGRHAELLHLQVLVLEQGEQRRHHHGRPRQQQRRELVAQRLTAARRHHEQHVALLQHRPDRALLLAIEPGQAKPLLGDLPDVVRGARRGFCDRCYGFESLHRFSFAHDGRYLCRRRLFEASRCLDTARDRVRTRPAEPRTGGEPGAAATAPSWLGSSCNPSRRENPPRQKRGQKSRMEATVKPSDRPRAMTPRTTLPAVASPRRTGALLSAAMRCIWSGSRRSTCCTSPVSTASTRCSTSGTMGVTLCSGASAAPTTAASPRRRTRGS